MSTPTPTTPDLASMLSDATSDTEKRVTIPDAISAYLAGEVTAFSAKPNTYKRDITINVPLATAILVERKRDLRLEGAELCEAGAKHFVRMLRQYATDHGLYVNPTRNVATITFRLARHQVKTPKSPVTVTHVGDAK